MPYDVVRPHSRRRGTGRQPDLPQLEQPRFLLQESFFPLQEGVAWLLDGPRRYLRFAGIEKFLEFGHGLSHVKTAHRSVMQ